jgi:Fe-S cluster assembly scaffold protein SufB
LSAAGITVAKYSRNKQAYFRINSENMGQFERTLIIADEGASVNYVEGCTVQIVPCFQS